MRSWSWNFAPPRRRSRSRPRQFQGSSRTRATPTSGVLFGPTSVSPRLVVMTPFSPQHQTVTPGNILDKLKPTRHSHRALRTESEFDRPLRCSAALNPPQPVRRRGADHGAFAHPLAVVLPKSEHVQPGL